MNCSMPKLANGSVNDSDNGGTWMPLYSEDSGGGKFPIILLCHSEELTLNRPIQT